VEDTCRECGAALSKDIPWCGQCFTPNEASSTHRPLSRDLHPREAVAAPSAAPAPTALAEPQNVVVVPEAERPSVLRGGPTSFGLLGKLLITLILAAIGVGAFLFLEEWRTDQGREMLAFEVYFLGAYAILAAVILVFTWRVERRPATVRVPESPVRRVEPPPSG
jgi:hypothetical protein